jgi:hypothetical protein
MADNAESPNLHIDEDWKTQVQAEKDALARAIKSDAGQVAEPTATVQPTSRSAASGPLPPASLLMLISMLATQATIGLGGISDPVSGKAEVDLEQARHFIDLLQVLEDKTQGNRTAQESAIFTRLLSELRLSFVALKDHTSHEGAATTAPE